MDQWSRRLGRRGQLAEWWWRRLGQPPVLWRRRIMDQPLVSVGSSGGCVAPEPDQRIAFVPFDLVLEQGDNDQRSGSGPLRMNLLKLDATDDSPL
jgi:hypothetical protein